MAGFDLPDTRGALVNGIQPGSPAEDAGIEMNEAKRNQMLADVSAIVAKDRPRLPITAVGSAWAMQKDKVTISPRVDEDTLAMDIKPAKK